MQGIPGGRFWLIAALAGALAGCVARPPPPPPIDPALLGAHEWEHGPPWAADEAPWAPPPVLAYAPPAGWGGYPAYGLGGGIVLGGWWRGGHAWRGGFAGHRGHVHRHGGGRRGGRR